MLSLWPRTTQTPFRERKLSHGVFTDIVSAFYSTLRQFVVGVPDAAAFTQWCRGKGMPDDTTNAVFAALLSDTTQPPALPSAAQKSRITDVLSLTWIVAHGTVDLVSTTRGTRPGDPCADLIYAFVMAGALKTLREV